MTSMTKALAILLSAVASHGCATTGATLGSGVGDALKDEPPYYAGSGATAPVTHSPIAYQAGASQEAFFDPEGGPGTPIDALLAEMNAYLATLGRSVPAPAPLPGTPPDVYFGCEALTLDGCDAESDFGVATRKPWMKLAVGRPSDRWTASAEQAMRATGTQGMLVITLEIGQYWTHQRDLLGRKEVRLGTGYEVAVPWLTSLDQPVQVLQLTGALIGPDGKAKRIGAEGMLARTTPLLAASVGAQALIRPEDVERLSRARRDDLPGRPLVWQTALRTLVEELTGE